MKAMADIIVKGIVQGVGFRWFVEREAKMFGLMGYVKNLHSGEVEIVVEGEDDFIKELIITNVVVFIPPPVPPGDAPINMKIIKRNKVVGSKSPIFISEKPAVLGVVAVKNDIMILVIRGKSDSLFLYSRSIITAKPITISDNVEIRTILEWRDKRLLLPRRRSEISCKTMNPRPPMINKKGAVKATKGIL